MKIGRLKKILLALLLAGVLVADVLASIGIFTPEMKEEGYRSIVIFRNDDIQPGFRLETMKKVNDVFIEEEVPVTLGIIPHPGRKAFLSGDSRLSGYLKDVKKAHPDLFELALHGYTHEATTSFYGKSEFGGLGYSSQEKRIKKGKKILENALGLTPVTFIPPFDTYDENTVLALKAHGFKVVSGGSWFTERYYGKTHPFVISKGITHAPELCGFVENWQSGSFHSLNYLKSRFENAYAENKAYIQMIHYFAFTTKEKINRLKAFIRFVKSHERVKFMTLGEFGESFSEGGG